MHKKKIRRNRTFFGRMKNEDFFFMTGRSVWHEVNKRNRVRNRVHTTLTNKKTE